ncbi:MAG: CoA-transferase subunit beta [Anaerolineae bacterium]|nr:CoA-transferase subunit beta [Anaerolineae bacterium]
MSEYTASEMMIAVAARHLAGARTAFVGVGIPNIACNLAIRTGNPTLALIYESGVYGAQPARLPLSIGDPTLVSRAASVMPMADLFMYYLQGGLVDVAMLGAAQIDRFGNLNSTIVGTDYDHPKVRLPGSGGACEIATNAKRILNITRLSKRTFVEKVDFITSPGYLAHRAEREALKMPGAGPQAVITDRCVLDFDPETGEMRLAGLYPGSAVEDVQAEIGWALKLAPALDEIAPPTADELRIMRDELDPTGMYRK